MDWSHELIYNRPGLLTCCLLLECRWTDEASAAFNVHIVPMFIQSVLFWVACSTLWPDELTRAVQNRSMSSMSVCLTDPSLSTPPTTVSTVETGLRRIPGYADLVAAMPAEPLAR